MYVPTPEDRAMVERLAALGVSQWEIARDWMHPPISKGTLRKYFKAELQRGRSRAFLTDALHTKR